MQFSAPLAVRSSRARAPKPERFPARWHAEIPEPAAPAWRGSAQLGEHHPAEAAGDLIELARAWVWAEEEENRGVPAPARLRTALARFAAELTENAV